MGNIGKALETPTWVLNRDGVEGLFRSNAGALVCFCHRFLADAALADDAVQQTFEIALRSFGDLRSHDRARAWIFKIARNECIRLLKRPSLRSLDENHADDPDATPLQATIDSDVRSLVRDSIDRLPPIYREAVLLRDMEGFAYAEIASITGITITAAKFRIFKGRELLMKMLQPVLKEWRMP